jgi:hypothetical protein
MRSGRLGLPGLLLALASLAASYRPSLAFEPQFAVNTTPGVTTGLLLGANPLPGLYYVNIAYAGQSTFVGGGASTGLTGFKSNTFTEAPIVLWSTPWTVLGASWSMLGVAPATWVNVFDDHIPIARVTGFHNPGFSPALLSWDLGGAWFGKLGVVFWAPIGTTAPGPFNNGLGNIGAPYWTIEPQAALSHFGPEWNFTANLIYGISTRNTDSHVINGNSLNLDIMAAKKFGNFEIGPVGYFSVQTTADSGCEAFYGPGVCARGSKAGLGGIVGFNFGFATLRIAVTDSVHIKNSVDGWRAWSTLTFDLWRDTPPPNPTRTK